VHSPGSDKTSRAVGAGFMKGHGFLAFPVNANCSLIFPVAERERDGVCVCMCMLVCVCVRERETAVTSEECHFWVQGEQKFIWSLT